MIGNIQIDSIMTHAITLSARVWSALFVLLLPFSTFAQHTTPAPTTAVQQLQQPILIDVKSHPLLYNNSTTTTNATATNAQVDDFDPRPDDPRDILVGDPLDLNRSHTRVNDQGQVTSTITSSCPKLMVDVHLPFAQSCVASDATITYCNHGGETAYNAYVQVTIDTNLQLDSASIAYTMLAPQQYRFDIGTIPAGLCGNINLHLTTACDPALLGTAHCIDAHIFPDTLCTAVQNSALLQVQGECLGNALKFRITNHGAPLTLSHQTRFIIIDDHLIATGQQNVLQQGNLQIPSNGDFTTTVSTSQHPTHMDYKMEIRDVNNSIIAICFVELCSSNPSHVPFVSDYYTNIFWNGSPFPFTDQGCAINGKTVVDASVDNNSAAALASENNGSANTNDNLQDGTLDDLHLQTPVEVMVGPNPIQHQAIIAIKGAESVVYQFELYSITGQLVRTLAVTGNSKTTLVRGELPAGFYVYRVLAKGVPLTEGKIIMQ